MYSAALTFGLAVVAVVAVVVVLVVIKFVGFVICEDIGRDTIPKGRRRRRGRRGR